MKQVMLAGIVLALTMLACGGSGELESTPTAPPSRAATAVPATVAAPSATPTSANTATPTITPGVLATATVLPTATPGARSNAAANLRAGPGTEFEQIGAVAVSDDLQVTGRNEAGDWYRLASGAWIAAFLVDGAPAGLPVADDIPTMAPPVAAVEPTDPPSTPAPVAAIGGQVRITGILRDGLVSQTETDEYVEITNAGDGPVDLTGWRLESERRGDDEQQIFHFPAGFTMNAGQVCRIYTNEDHPEWCELSFNHGRGGVWANSDPDAAVLIDAAGVEVQRWE